VARVAAFGPRNAEALRRRLGQLNAIESLEEVRALPCDTNEDSDGMISITVIPPLRLLVRAILHGHDTSRRLAALEIFELGEEGEAN